MPSGRGGYMRDASGRRLDDMQVQQRKLLSTPGPFMEANRLVTTGESCIGVDETLGLSFWTSVSALYLSNDGGATRVIDPGSNGGRPSAATTAGFHVLNMKRQGTQPFWWALVKDVAANRVSVWRTPAVATPGTAMAWTKMADGFPGSTPNNFGLDISPDGTTVCFGDYQTVTAPPDTGCGIWRSHSTDGGATFPAFAKVYTVSSASIHVHDVYASRHQAGLWLATAGDGPSSTSADYLLVSNDDGATWTSRTQAQFHRNFQSVSISEGDADDPYIYLAPDVTGTDLILLDRETLVPYATLANHQNSAVPRPGTFSDGKVTSGTPTLTTALSQAFLASDVGRRVSGNLIPDGTTITAYTSSKQVTMSANATGTSTTGVLTFTVERPERFCRNVFLGKVDPDTGIYYYVTSDDQGTPAGSSAARYALFALLPGASSPILLEMLPQASLGIHLDHATSKVYAGQVARPLL